MIPTFKYHPNPIETGAFIAANTDFILTAIDVIREHLSI